MSYCRYGKAYQKNTRFRIWGKCLAILGKLCSKKKGVLACGHKKHKNLGWDGESTAAAATYPQALCEAYAEAITKDSDAEETPRSSEEDLPAGVKRTTQPGLQSTENAEKAVEVASHGRVRRHISRGVDLEGQKERKQKEDEVCAAGLHNAWKFQAEHAKMQKAMNKLTPSLAPSSRRTRRPNTCTRHAVSPRT